MSKFRVLISHDVPSHTYDILKDSCEIIFPSSKDDLIEKLKTVHAVLMYGVGMKYDEELLKKIEGGPLKIVAIMGVGTDHLDLEALKKRGILASNTAGSLDNTVAEVAVCFALSAGHRFKQRSESVAKGIWIREPLWMCGQDIFGSTFGIVGLGRIGRAVAKKVYGFEPSRILYSGNEPKDYAEEFNGEFVPLDTLLKESDFVILACPLTNETFHLINADRLKLMKKNAVIVNIARGNVIDQDALIKALQDGSIAGAGMDTMVPEPLPPTHPLAQLNNCILTPHAAHATYATACRMAQMAAKNIYCALNGKPIPNLLKN